MHHKTVTVCEMLMLHWYTLVCNHELSWGSWVSLLYSSILCVYLSSEAPPTCCYHGDSSSWVSGLQGSEEMFSVLNSVRNGGESKNGNTCMYLHTQCTHSRKTFLPTNVCSLASFPGLPTIQFLIACSMRNRGGKPGIIYHMNDVSVT